MNLRSPRILSFVTLLLVGAVACTGGTGDQSAGTAPPATPEAAAPQRGPYAPDKDPLVNPPSLLEPAPADTTLIETDETLIRNISGNPSTLNPLFASSTYEFSLNELLYDGPFSFDREMKWHVNDAMVDAFEESDDHKVYTVTLKEGLTWQDGAPFTARDVCFSYEVIMDDRVPAPAVRSGTDQIDKCEVISDQVFKLYHKEALPTSKWNALFPLVPKHLFEKEREAHPDLKTGDYYEKLGRHPVGNGPYKIVEWVPNDKIVLERWDGYPGEKPFFKRQIFRIIPDSNILLLSFNKSEIDEFRMSSKQFATQTGPGSDFAKAGGVKRFAPQWAFSYIGWNMDGSNPFFTDRRVRRAMTHAIDIDRIIRDLLFNLATPCRGIFHPDSWMFNPEVQRIPYDLDKAAALLDEAGWLPDEEQGGWRYKTIDGNKVKFEFTLLIPQGSSTGVDMAAIVQEDLQSIGVSMKTQILEWATFMERTRKHEFQASTAGWGTGTDPDTNWNLWHSDQYDPEGRFGRNYVGFKNARVDELFELARHEFDRDKRRSYYQEIQKIIYDEQPYTFLWNSSTLWGIQKRIRGVQAGPRGVFNFSPSVLAWWVKKGEAKYATATTP